MGILKHSPARIKEMLGLELDYQVEFDCAEKDYIGSKKCGWCICPDRVSGESVLYSLGVGKDISFDLAMMEKYKVQVYAFDPTPLSIEWIKSRNVPERYHFFGYGIASFDGTAMLYDNPDRNSQSILHRPKGNDRGVEVQFHTLKTVMDALGHKNIDILKMDIEGAEYKVIDGFLSLDLKVDQLLVEFHHNKFKGVRVSDTRRIIRRLHEHGFRIYYLSPQQREFSFIRI